MSIPDVHIDEPVIEETSRAANLLQKAQERRQKRETHLYLDVPTWDGDLVAEYRILDPDEMRMLADQTAARLRQGDAEPGSNDMDLLNAMCVGLHVFDREETKLEPIIDDFGIVNFTRIDKFLGKQHILKTAFDAIKYLMSERDPDD